MHAYKQRRSKTRTPTRHRRRIITPRSGLGTVSVRLVFWKAEIQARTPVPLSGTCRSRRERPVVRVLHGAFHTTRTTTTGNRKTRYRMTVHFSEPPGLLATSCLPLPTRGTTRGEVWDSRARCWRRASALDRRPLVVPVRRAPRAWGLVRARAPRLVGDLASHTSPPHRPPPPIPSPSGQARRDGMPPIDARVCATHATCRPPNYSSPTCYSSARRLASLGCSAKRCVTQEWLDICTPPYRGGRLAIDLADGVWTASGLADARLARGWRSRGLVRGTL